MSIQHQIQTGYTNLHFWWLRALYKDAIQNKNLHLHSSTKYCANANNHLKKWLLLKNHARLSSIHKPAFLDIKFFWYFYHVICVENHKNWVYLFTGHPVHTYIHTYMHSYRNWHVGPVLTSLADKKLCLSANMKILFLSAFCVSIAKPGLKIEQNFAIKCLYTCESGCLVVVCI